MANKTLGYILAGLGILGLLIGTFEPLRKLVPISDSLLKGMPFMIVMLVLVVLGAVLMSKKKQAKEVPIYDKNGKHIVGYRRMTK